MTQSTPMPMPTRKALVAYMIKPWSSTSAPYPQHDVKDLPWPMSHSDINGLCTFLRGPVRGGYPAPEIILTSISWLEPEPKRDLGVDYNDRTV